MQIFFDLDKVFFMVGAATCVIVPGLLALWAWSSFKVVRRGKDGS